MRFKTDETVVTINGHTYLNAFMLLSIWVYTLMKNWLGTTKLLTLQIFVVNVLVL
jgi:hypothetical protein